MQKVTFRSLWMVASATVVTKFSWTDVTSKFIVFITVGRSAEKLSKAVVAEVIARLSERSSSKLESRERRDEPLVSVQGMMSPIF